MEVWYYYIYTIEYFRYSLYPITMTKHTAMIFLGILVMVIPELGFPSWARTTLIVLSGLGIVVLAYLSSVTYCSNCKKLIDDAEQALPAIGDEVNPPQTQ